MTAQLCPECRCEEPPHTGPGVPVKRPGTLHHAWCPTLPHLSPEAEEEMRRGLDQIADARRRAWAESMHIVIGGAS